MYVTAGHFQALKLGLSVGYEKFEGTGYRKDSIVDRADPNNWRVTTYTEHLSVKNTMILLNLYATYTVNPLSRLKFYLKAGHAWGFGKEVYVLDDYDAETVGFNSGNKLYTEVHDTEQIISISSLPSPIIGAGIQYDRHKLEISYYYPMDASATSSKVFKIGMAGIHYYYTILK